MRKIIFLCVFLLFSQKIAVAADDTWKEFRSEHFVIYYQEAPLTFVEDVAEAAGREYEDIARNLGFTRYQGWTWDKRAKIYIFDDQEHYINSQNPSWSHGVTSPRDKVIRTFPMANGFFDTILPHELGHVIFREFVGNETPIPLWLEEGVAMYQEKAKRWGANKTVQQAMREGQFIPLKELTLTTFPYDPDQQSVDLFYAEAASVVYYMITELGELRFMNFCRELKNRKLFDEAVHRAYIRFNNLDDLNKAWMRYLSP
jgi:hypothetical protein